MDFGLMGMEGLVGQQETGSPDPDGKRKWSGSGFFKQERSGSGSPEEEDPSSRAPKVAKNGLDLGLSKALAMQQQELLMRSTDGGLCRPPQSQMLSFASPTPQLSFLSISKDGGGGDKASQTLPYYQHLPSPVYSRNAGYASGSMHGSFTGIRGPFTPAQWIELEHQALIYKYLTANVPVPSTLLVPIRKALNSSGFSGFSAGSFPAHPYGWGPFHLGYSGSTDPEPGRCRRTDGKKWRCSRDAVPDQKYCERHINRGRHRSRKPVEGQSGQAAASGPTNPKVVPLSSATSSTVASGGSASNSLAIVSHQLKSLQAGAPDPETDPVVNRYKRLQDPQGLSMMPTTINLKPNKDSSHFSIPEQKNPYKPLPEFGFVSTDALLNPLPKNYNSFLDFNNDHLKSDWTQLSMMPSELSSPRSPNEEKLAPSPLRLSHELNQRQMGLGVGNSFNEAGPKQHGNWIPVSWGNSMGGGPLGEVLNNTGSAVGSCKSTSSSALNLMGEGWNGSPQLDSSPTGVLQKGAFVSLSNSGSGSSPADDNKKTQETGHLADELLGSAHVASSIPTL